ncbi:VWA domain-containing protein [Nitratireductor aquibiodomus]|nr:VWA domain-containing protein [Nitratireductor aquibiodomus]
MMTALSAMALIGASGFALDYSNMGREHSQLQNALDTAALAVAQRGKKISDAEAESIARSFLDGNLPATYYALKVDRDGRSVRVTANVDVDLLFGGIFGKKSMPVGATSQADVALVSYEIALVLDTTGSMRGRKLRDMKKAVEEMIDNISAQVDNKERLRFALVPFSTFVNVGPQYGPEFDNKGKMKEGTGASWLDLYGESEVPQLELQTGISRFQAYNRLGVEWKGCVETRMRDGTTRHDVAATPSDRRDPASLFVPAFAIDEPGTGRSERFYNDYLDSSVDPLDNSVLGKVKKVGKYGFDLLGNLLGGKKPKPKRNAPGPNYMCSSEPLTPLTNDYTILKSKVRQFEAEGNTNIMEGVSWGARVLSPDEPFPAGNSEDGLVKVMVVLTDGANTFGVLRNRLRSRYTSFGYMVEGRLEGEVNASSGRSTRLMNDKTIEACDFAKKSGIDIYTIRLEVRDTGTGDMMRSCASRPDQYFDTPSSRQLKEVFDKIGEQIVKLRLSS